MSLFGNRLSALSNRQDTLLSPAEACATFALVAIAADGYMTNEEISSLTITLSRMQLFRSYSSDVMRRLFDKLLSQLQRSGRENLLKAAVQSLPHELHETVFAVTTDLVLADGEVTEEEENLLNYLYQILGIQETNAIKIIDVMVIKNKG